MATVHRFGAAPGGALGVGMGDAGAGVGEAGVGVGEAGAGVGVAGAGVGEAGAGVGVVVGTVAAERYQGVSPIAPRR